MKIREATTQDKATWNTFVDTEYGSFLQYYDWKHVFENRGYTYIPLLAENNAIELVGILPIIREKRFLSSILHSDARTEGLLLKSNLADMERYEVISAFSEYVDAHYSDGCSRFTLRERLPLAEEMSEEPDTALIDNGFRFRYDKQAHLPCTFILKLKQPFEENIWKGLWSHKFRQKINKIKRSGAVVIHDRELNYVDDFIDMFFENCKRHGTTPPTREQVMFELHTFRDRVKLYFALLDNQPIVALLCYYSASTCCLWEMGSYEKDTDNATLLCYTAAIEEACNTGYKFADLGFTSTPGLAFFKEHFRANRIPFTVYEKRFSIPRTIMETAPRVIKAAWHDKTYLWKKRHRLWDRIIHW
ncbi:MAG: GNAT family N-acetyltransferase [Dehalococcoidales bacterium]|nr:MAG: GNAT family N-acetyltransferase [Dehalococcoidales bacterium]